MLIGGQSGGQAPTPALSADWGKILVGYYSLTLASFAGIGFFSSTDTVSVTLMRRKYLLVFAPLLLTAMVPVVGADIRHWNTGATVLTALWAATCLWALSFYLTARSPRPGRLPIEHRYITAEIPRTPVRCSPSTPTGSMPVSRRTRPIWPICPRPPPASGTGARRCTAGA